MTEIDSHTAQTSVRYVRLRHCVTGSIALGNRVACCVISTSPEIPKPSSDEPGLLHAQSPAAPNNGVTAGHRAELSRQPTKHVQRMHCTMPSSNEHIKSNLEQTQQQPRGPFPMSNILSCRHCAAMPVRQVSLTNCPVETPNHSINDCTRVGKRC